MPASGELLFVGCFSAATGGTGRGIRRVRRDPVSGAIRDDGLAAETPDPNWLTVGPDPRVLHATRSGPAGAVLGYGVEDDGALRPLSRVSSQGDDPCGIAFSGDGRWAVVPNFLDGVVSLHPVVDGLVGAGVARVRHRGRGPVAPRQDVAHPHSAAFVTPGVVAVPDLSLDAVLFYDCTSGDLVPVGRVPLPLGMGPRHSARVDSRLYVNGEIDSTVAVIQLVAHGGELVSTVSALPENISVRNLPSELIVSPDGRWLFVAHRGADLVAVLDLTDPDAPTVRAALPAGGSWPRHIALIDDDLYVCAGGSDLLVHYRLAADDPTRILAQDAIEVASPSCVVRVDIPETVA